MQSCERENKRGNGVRSSADREEVSVRKKDDSRERIHSRQVSVVMPDDLVRFEIPTLDHLS